MGLLSSLGLLLIPLVSRSRSTSIIPIDSETKRLKAELAEARAEVERLRLELLHWMDFADAIRRSTPPPMPIHQININEAQAQNYQQAAAMAAQNFYSEPFQQQNAWPPCTCVPGRSALLQEDN